MFYREVIGRNVSARSINSRNSFQVSSSQFRRRRENMPVAYSITSHGSSPEATPAVQWSPMESDAIRQWRGMTTLQSRSEHNEPRTLSRESQPRSTDSLRSDASLSSSGDSVSSNKKAQDVTAHLKYLVRGFLRQMRATPANDDTRKLTNNEYFVPSPKITFLIDEPTNLICQICQQAPLKLSITEEGPGPFKASILPCGHISCYNCMSLWFANHTTCPFCRSSMIHTGCGHQVKPRLIAQDTIHSLPKTLSDGGKIGNKCFKCTERDRRELSVERWTNLAEKYKAARRKADILGTDQAVEDMRRAQKAFEEIPEDDYSVLSSMRHHQW
ncbi:hypothetical protein F5Y12DRAFT_770545 [Xylaria sp. FL1777]|nr:hypothetical protein F5Y12DRAFT_770545 [Xylaria sp. FL1777]